MIKFIKYLFLLKAILGAVFGVIYYWGFFDQRSILLAYLFFINAIVFLWLNSEITSEKKWIYWFSVIYIFVGMFITFFEQFSVIISIITSIDILILGLLIINYKKLVLKNNDPS